MAGFRTHITVSGVLGVAYGGIAVQPVGFSTEAGVLAAGVTAVGGMLPDLVPLSEEQEFHVPVVLGPIDFGEDEGAAHGLGGQAERIDDCARDEQFGLLERFATRVAEIALSDSRVTAATVCTVPPGTMSLRLIPFAASPTSSIARSTSSAARASNQRNLSSSAACTAWKSRIGTRAMKRPAMNASIAPTTEATPG
mgnify:CR=1 FL=1